MKNLLLIMILCIECTVLFAQRTFAPVFVHPFRVDKEYNTHGVYLGMHLIENKVNSNGIHTSLISMHNDIQVNGIYANQISINNTIKVNGVYSSIISIGNDIEVNGIHASLLSVGNTIKVNGIYANLISFNDEIEVNGLYLNLLEISDQISLINARFLGIVSFAGLALGPRISLAQLSIGGLNVGIVNTNLGRGSRSLGVLNFNVNCKIPISPIIGRGCRERTRFYTCAPRWQ